MSIGTLPTMPLAILPLPAVLRSPNAPPLRRWTVAEYQRMIDANILKAKEQVHLLEGWIVYKVPRGADSPTFRRWTVEEYHRLMEIDVLKESEPVELLQGWIVQKMSRNTPHDTTLNKTEEAIRGSLPSGWRLRSQMAISTGDSEPEPDCAIVSGDLDAYLANHPKPEDVAFLVEISDTTLATDRKIKGAAYGFANIDIYWIVNIPDRQVEVYTEPTGVTDPPEAAGYRVRADYRETDAVPVVIRGQEVARIVVASLLPRV